MHGIVIIAHAPLASALRACALHVFADCGPAVVAVDVPAHAPPEQTLASARVAIEQAGMTQVLILTDVFGATPSNIAQKMTDGQHIRLVAGVNLPMLLRAVTYRHEPLESLVARAMVGGTQGVMQVAAAAPQNQSRRTNDQNHRDHQQ
jgi:mannose PTS system EIIA component